MKRVAVFISRYGIGNSPSIINVLDLLSDYYKVDVFLHKADLTDAPVLKKENINVKRIRRRHLLWHKVRNTFIHYAPYSNYLCFDPHGFVLCKDLFPWTNPYYYSLELYILHDHYGLIYPPETQQKERKWIHDIKGLIIQSKEKESIFRSEYGIENHAPTFLLPVTYAGKSCGEKSDYLRKKYGIGKDKKIALHLGEIKWWYSCIEIAERFGPLKDWVLLFHGYYDEDYLVRLRSVVRHNKLKNVIISDEFHDSIDSIDEIVKSCDVGIAWYNDITSGFRCVGKSSGKISAYLRFGLPVIVTQYPSTIDAIENTGCGVCVEGYEDINGALDTVLQDYKKYSDNAIDEYEKTYWFERYKDGLLKFIQ